MYITCPKCNHRFIPDPGHSFDFEDFISELRDEELKALTRNLAKMVNFEILENE